jgi:hypothetical protein
VSGSSLSTGVAVASGNDASMGGLLQMNGFEENNKAYIYATRQSDSPKVWQVDCSSTANYSNTCSSPYCDSATRIITVSNDGGGGTGTGGADDGTGRRTWFWWLKYYLNL